jgi:hypothetical protein
MAMVQTVLQILVMVIQMSLSKYYTEVVIREEVG